MTKIYGVDMEKPINPEDVRDAIVECFTQAHSQVLDEMKKYSDDLGQSEFEEIKRINIQQLIRNYFSDVGGDYDTPTKESIMQVLGKLKEFAANFRNPEIIKKHYTQIMQLVNQLK